METEIKVIASFPLVEEGLAVKVYSQLNQFLFAISENLESLLGGGMTGQVSRRPRKPSFGVNHVDTLNVLVCPAVKKESVEDGGLKLCVVKTCRSP